MTARNPSPPTPPGAPTSLAVQAARNGILASSMAVFGRLGFTATRVEDLLAASGIARRTFYRYFTGKEDVLAAIYRLTTDELLRAMRDEGDQGGDPLLGIRGVMDRYLDFHTSNAQDPATANLLCLLMEQAVRADSPLSPLRKRFRAQMVEVLTRAAKVRGGKAFDPLMGIALISALEGVSFEVLESGPTARAVGRAKQTMHALLSHVFDDVRR